MNLTTHLIHALFYSSMNAGVHGLLCSSTSLVALNVEGCHRLFGCQSCAPDGFEIRQDAKRPALIVRLPPDTL